MKTPSIQLSLVGDRRLICLTTATVRTAYHQFAAVNRGYTRRIARSFDPNDSCLYELLNSSYFDTVGRNDISLIVF